MLTLLKPRIIPHNTSQEDPMKSLKKTAPKPKAKTERGPREGTITAAWAELFAQNEGRVKAGQKGWTDPELVERMQKQFPDHKNKTTITRVSMVRGCYNKGTNMFAAVGPAGKSGRPSATQHGGRAKAQRSAKATGKVTKPSPKTKAKETKPAVKPKLVLKIKTKAKSLTTNPKGGAVSVDHGEEG